MTRAQIGGLILLAFFTVAALLIGVSRRVEQHHISHRALLDDIDAERTRDRQQ